MYNDSVLLDMFWTINGIEKALYNRSDDSVSKYVHEFQHDWNAYEIWDVVDVDYDFEFSRRAIIKS